MAPGTQRAIGVPRGRHGRSGHHATGGRLPVAMHVRLNGIESATNLDRPDRMAIMVRLDDDDRNRLYLEPDRITKILIHGGVKIWFLERFYVGLS